MIVVDEYVAVRVVLGRSPDAMPDDDVGLPTSGHWRLLQALHRPRGGQLTQLFAPLSETEREALRWPHPEVLQVLDPRPLLDQAARIAAAHNVGGLRNAEILAAGVQHRADLWFGSEANVGPRLQAAADRLGLAVHIAS